VGASKENNLSLNEIKAAEFSLTQLIMQLSNRKQEETEITDLWLLDSNQSTLMKAEKLVWADKIELKGRCEQMMKEQFGLSFALVNSNLSSRQHFALLCKHLALRTLSAIVTEKVTHEGTFTKPNKHEQYLEKFIKSELFAKCHCECLNESSNKDMHNKVHEIFSSIDFLWSSTKLQAALYAKDSNNRSVLIKDSHDNKLAFIQGRKLWLQSGILYNENESDIFNEISLSLFQLLGTIPQLNFKRHDRLPYILKNYKNRAESLSLAI